MPSIPIPIMACLTSSNLNGWMMGSIFFISGLQEIPLFAVHGEIQALAFLIVSGADTEHRVANLQDNQRADNRQQPGNENTATLIQHLDRVAVDQTERRHVALRILQAVVDQVRGENPGEDCA